MCGSISPRDRCRRSKPSSMDGGGAVSWPGQGREEAITAVKSPPPRGDLCLFPTYPAGFKDKECSILQLSAAAGDLLFLYHGILCNTHTRNLNGWDRRGVFSEGGWRGRMPG